MHKHADSQIDALIERPSRHPEASGLVFYKNCKCSGSRQLRMRDRLLRSINSFISTKLISRNDKNLGENCRKPFCSLFLFSCSPSRAFTLSEVLLTLGIIGVLAALTLPALINNIQDAQYKTAYKKAYSVASQAFLKASQEGDIVEITGVYSAIGGDANFDAIKKQFKVVKECDSAHLSYCWSSGFSTFRGSPTVNATAFIDNSGMVWANRGAESDALFPGLLVDTNGNKTPNQWGKDRFPFVYANEKNSGLIVFYVDDLGMPTKLIPLADVVSTSPADHLMNCPSSNHTCYYTSWLYD